MHENLKCDDYPLYAKVKAEYLADFCQTYQKNLDDSMKSLINLNQI